MATLPSNPIATLVCRGAWVSPNQTRADHWSRLVKLKKKIQTEVNMHALTMDIEEKKRILLMDEPRKRRVRYTIVSRRGTMPDSDNAVAGLKILQDCLQRIQLKRIKVAHSSAKPPGQNGKGLQNYSMARMKSGPGFIWDDSHEWLEILKVQCETETLIYPEGTRFVVVEIYEDQDYCVP